MNRLFPRPFEHYGVRLVACVIGAMLPMVGGVFVPIWQVLAVAVFVFSLSVAIEYAVDR